MRIKRSFQATALMLAAVVLGLLATQGTYALWSATAQADAGTIQAANFDVLMGDSSTQKLMTGADGQPAVLNVSTSTSGILAPGSPLYAGIALTNQSNASADFRVQVTGGSASIEDNSKLAAYVSIASGRAATLAQCPTADYAATPPSARIDKQETGVLCYRATLAANAPAELNGATGTVAIPLTAEQL